MPIHIFGSGGTPSVHVATMFMFEQGLGYINQLVSVYTPTSLSSLPLPSLLIFELDLGVPPRTAVCRQQIFKS